ncbi:CapA family protein [Caballeronia sp. ATUFL_M1_KS5A]|uniref:CapA family protein n=1 Tax=Caballeronia sp. ATUFL_M1_KS5A TaxID=2921778 RepID=UPI0020292142|nr:CapA family protein [Caballeronia sp. ATUFL_M1_KS5A]
MLATFLIVISGTTAFATPAETSVDAWTPPPRQLAAELRMKIDEPFTVATVGDIIEPQPIADGDPRFTALISQIRHADVGFGNMEMSLVDFDHFEGAVAGTLAPLSAGDAIKGMGINLVNHANNHTFDGGVMGMISTDRALNTLDIAHAGTGRNLQEARDAQFLATRRGRVGLVGMFSVDDADNFGPGFAKMEATYRHGNLGGAPGVNMLHLTSYHVVAPSEAQQLRDMYRSIFPAVHRDADAPSESAPVPFFDEWYVGGTDPGALRYAMRQKDEDAILQSIRDGRVASDFVIATIPSHQTAHFCAPCAGLVSGSIAPGMKEGVDHDVPDFLIKLAHDSIDAGADMFIVHGVHTLRGVEIYKDKPIFYGLSNFVFQFGLQLGATENVMENERTMSDLENPATQEALLTTTRFEGGKLKEVRLYPVDLGGSRRPISRMGVPLTPSPQDAQRILHDLQAYPRPLGTTISIVDHVGVVDLTHGR